MKNILAAVALSAVALGAGAAVTTTGGTQKSFVGTFDPTGFTINQFTSGLSGSVINTTAGALSATFLGKEANDTDTFAFVMSSGTLFNTGPIGSTITGNVGAGPFTFSFTDMTSGVSASSGFVVLGTFGTGGSFTPYTDGGAYQLVLAFNDGLNVDGDFDDMVVGLNVSAVPEPETYALLLAGFGAIGFIARRRRSK